MVQIAVQVPPNAIAGQTVLQVQGPNGVPFNARVPFGMVSGQTMLVECPLALQVVASPIYAHAPPQQNVVRQTNPVIQGTLQTNPGIQVTSPITQGTLLQSKSVHPASRFHWIKFVVIELLELGLFILAIVEALELRHIDEVCTDVMDCDTKHWCNFESDEKRLPGQIYDAAVFQECNCHYSMNGAYDPISNTTASNDKSLSDAQGHPVNQASVLIVCAVFAYFFSQFAQFQQWPTRCSYTGWHLYSWRCADLSMTLIMVLANMDLDLPDEDECQSRDKRTIRKQTTLFTLLWVSVGLVMIVMALAWCQLERRRTEELAKAEKAILRRADDTSGFAGIIGPCKWCCMGGPCCCWLDAMNCGPCKREDYDVDNQPSYKATCFVLMVLPVGTLLAFFSSGYKIGSLALAIALVEICILVSGWYWGVDNDCVGRAFGSNDWWVSAQEQTKRGVERREDRVNEMIQITQQKAGVL